MTVKHACVATCDGCGATVDVPDYAQPFRWLVEHGWTSGTPSGRDYCAACTARGVPKR